MIAINIFSPNGATMDTDKADFGLDVQIRRSILRRQQWEGIWLLIAGVCFWVAILGLMA